MCQLLWIRCFLGLGRPVPDPIVAMDYMEDLAMTSQRRTRPVIFTLAATFVLYGTNALAVSRSAQGSSQARSVSRSAIAQPRATRRAPSSTVRRSPLTPVTSSRIAPQASARSSTAAHSSLLSRNRTMNAPRSAHGFSHNPGRFFNPVVGNHRPGPIRHRDYRHSSTRLGFGFSLGIAAPPPVTVVQPWYAGPPVVSAPIVVAPPPVVQVPAAPPVLSAPQGVLFEAVVSRDDHIAPKSLLTIDGIVLKIKDTDWDPLDVDIELSILGNSLDFDDIPLGSTVEVYGQSGQLYRVHILAIDDDSETLRFAISQ